MFCDTRDFTKPIEWFDILLDWSNHAYDRAFERDLPIIDFLPLNAEYVTNKKCKRDCFMFKVSNYTKEFEIVLNPDGKVITVFPIVKTMADKFQYKYKRYLGEFKKPENYIAPVIFESDFVLESEFA